MAEPVEARTLGDVDRAAPKFQVEVNGIPVEDDLSRLIDSVEFETDINMSSVMNLVIENPDFRLLTREEDAEAVMERLGYGAQGVDLVSHTIFQPGQFIRLLLGYGSDAATPVGHALVSRHMPDFPRDGMPSLQVKGYDASQLMAGYQGAISGTGNLGDGQYGPGRIVTADPQRNQKPQLVQTRGKRVESKTYQGEIYKKGSVATDIVIEIAEKYNFKWDVDPDPTPPEETGLIQKKGLHDFQFVKHLANIYSKEFWVDFDDTGKVGNPPLRKGWVLHWKTPGDLTGIDPRFVFRYADGDATSLLDFHPEYALNETTTDVRIFGYDPEDGNLVAIAEIEPRTFATLQWRKGGGRGDAARPLAEYYSVPQKAPRAQSAAAALAAQLRGSLNEKTADYKKRLKLAQQQDLIRGGLSAKFRPGAGTPPSRKTLRAKREIAERIKEDKRINRALGNTSARTFKMQVNGIAVDLPRPSGHLTLERIKLEAARWLFYHRNAFITARGVIVGNEEVAARQLHVIEGVSPAMDGLWYFTNVRHQANRNGIYECPFSARKVLD